MFIVFLPIGIQFKLKKTVEKTYDIQSYNEKPFGRMCKYVHNV
jgi:hypothetical protein